jgi:hypothetical protein
MTELPVQDRGFVSQATPQVPPLQQPVTSQPSNPPQAEVPPVTPASSPSTGPAEAPQNSKLIPVLSGAILLLLAGVGFLAYQLSAKPAAPAPTPEPLTITDSAQNDTDPIDENLILADTDDSDLVPAGTVTWKNGSFIHDNGEEQKYGPRTFTVEYQLPSTWIDTAEKTQCPAHVFTNTDTSSSVRVEPICSGFVGKSQSTPADAVLLKTIDDATDDGSRMFLIRYFDATTNSYKYVMAGGEAGETFDPAKHEMGTHLSITHKPYQPHDSVFTYTSFVYTGPEAQKAAALTEADKVVLSLVLKSE